MIIPESKRVYTPALVIFVLAIAQSSVYSQPKKAGSPAKSHSMPTAPLPADEPLLEPDGCRDAQVIAIRGQWIASPGARPLVQWACVAAGDELMLASGSSTGEITVVYHDGSIAPHTEQCPSPTDCPNAYQVKRASVPKNPKSAINEALEFFFSIFKKGETKPVPGILHGWAPPPSGVLCSEGRDVYVASDFWSQSVAYELPGGLRSSKFPVESEGTRSLENVYITWEAKDRYSFSTASPLGGPALYTLESKEGNVPQGSTLVLVAPKTVCNPLARSYSVAVDLTNNWPKAIPREAIWNFRSAYLLGLASKPQPPPASK